MADVIVTLADGSQRVVDDSLLRLPPAQEPPLASFVTVAATGGDETWWRPPAGTVWVPTDDPSSPQPWSFVVARDTAAQPATIYRGGRRVAETMAAQVLTDHVRVLTGGGNHVRVQKAGAAVTLGFNAVSDTMTPASAVALGLGLLGAALH